MGTGAITQYMDVAQLALYGFWLFFFGLVWYLHRENKREGYPLYDSHNPNYRPEGFPAVPDPKTYYLPHGQGTRTAPRQDPPQYELKAEQLNPAAGFPLEPTGNPMKDGVGPAAWATRPEKPDLTYDGRPKIVPLRVATDYVVESRDPDPRGRPVYGVDGVAGATVSDVWVDRSEPQIRYLELAVDVAAPAQASAGDDEGESQMPAGASKRRVMIPMNFTRVKSNGDVHVKSVCGRHFADAPSTANPDQITLQEEDKIGAYYAGGYLYAVEDRTEPLI
jgi:photosynthetic reaction center H subunit